MLKVAEVVCSDYTAAVTYDWASACSVQPVLSGWGRTFQPRDAKHCSLQTLAMLVSSSDRSSLRSGTIGRLYGTGTDRAFFWTNTNHNVTPRHVIFQNLRYYAPRVKIGVLHPSRAGSLDLSIVTLNHGATGVPENLVIKIRNTVNDISHPILRLTVWKIEV